MKKLFLIILLAIPLLAASYRPAPALAQPEPTPTPPAVLLVNSTADPGDGVCDDAECTLREAIATAEEGATVEFSLPEASTITLVEGELEIEQSLTIDGSTAPGLTVSGNNSSRVFSTSAGTIKMKNLTIANGYFVDDGLDEDDGGGGIKNTTALRLENVTIRDNDSERNGGGIFNQGGPIILVNSTISQNRAGEHGGGIYSRGSILDSELHHCDSGEDGLARLYSSTVTGNLAQEGGGIFDQLGDGTYCDYAAPIYTGDGRTFATNTIIIGNSALIYADCGGFIGDPSDQLSQPPREAGEVPGYPGGFNLLGNSCNTRPTDIAIPSPLAHFALSALSENGGFAPTHALKPGSPALDAGDPAGCTYDDDGNPDTPEVPLLTDQRGFPRPMEGNGDGNARCDIGAYEAQSYTPGPILPTPPSLIQVNSTADPGDGFCDTDECTLREAIALANPGATIEFTLPANATLILTDGHLGIDKGLTIDGRTAPGLAISSDYASDILHIHTLDRVNLKNLSITRGTGGIFNKWTTLSIENVTIHHNRSQASGGGLRNEGGHVVVTNSTISSNEANSFGGGIYNGDACLGSLWQTTAVIRLYNTTITNNTTATIPTVTLD